MSIIKEFKNSINNNSNLKNKEIDYIPSYKNTIDNYNNYVESVLKSLFRRRNKKYFKFNNKKK